MGGQLKIIPQAQLEERVEEAIQDYAWSTRRRASSQAPPQDKKSGKFELDQDTLKAFMEGVIDKKLGKGEGSFPKQSQQVFHFACEICGGTNHDASYCGGADSEHIAAVGMRYEGNQGGPRGGQAYGNRGFHNN